MDGVRVPIPSHPERIEGPMYLNAASETHRSFASLRMTTQKYYRAADCSFSTSVATAPMFFICSISSGSSCTPNFSSMARARFRCCMESQFSMVSGEDSAVILSAGIPKMSLATSRTCSNVLEVNSFLPVSVVQLLSFHLQLNPIGAAQRGTLQIERPQRARAVCLLPLEAMLRVEIAGGSVFLRRQKPAHQPRMASLGCTLGAMGGFDCSSDDSAAQQEGIDFALLAFVVRDRDSDQPVVAETIAHPDRKYVPPRLFRHLRNLRFGVTPCGQVELVGFLRQLRDPRHRLVRHGFQFSLLLEEAKKLFLRLKALLGAGTLLLCGI